MILYIKASGLWETKTKSPKLLGTDKEIQTVAVKSGLNEKMVSVPQWYLNNVLL